jgi:2-haloacid dehalogenase
MDSITEVLVKTKTLTFDCYGTLIDWEAGLKASLGELFGELPAGKEEEVLRAYIEAEAAVQTDGYKPYSEVLAITAERVGRMFDIVVPPGTTDRMAELLPAWPPFPDTNAALTRLNERYRLGILSNIERHLFEATAKHFDVEFDFVITGEDVLAYKPSHLHFHRLINAYDGRDSTVHVAQSLFHDGVPAGQLGIPFVWINRRGQKNDTEAKPLAEFPDMGSFAEAACA